jgi:lipoprotein NlpI
LLGVARYAAGDFKGASADLLRSMEIDEDAYAMLYRFLARSRAGESAEAGLEADARRLKTKEWPFAVTELYLGRRSPAETLAAAAKPDQKCEAQFYIGQWHVVKGNRADAETALQAAVDTCPKTFVEYRAAVVELKRLQP